MNPLVQSMILHCGGKIAERNELELVETPEATKSWTPIPHVRLIDEVKSALAGQTIDVVAEQHALARGGDRYFGLLQVSNRSAQEDFAYVVGLRNSHDKSYPAALVVGSRVFVCDNLAFSGEVSVTRKHTTNILRDLQGLTCKAVGFLAEKWMDQERRIQGYRDFDVSDARAHDLVVRALDARVISARQLPKVVAEWRQPRHVEFETRNAWSLFNCFTEVLKETSLFELPPRTKALHGLFDHQVGLLANLAAAVGSN